MWRLFLLPIEQGTLKWLHSTIKYFFDEIASASSAKNLKIKTKESSRLLWGTRRLCFGGTTKNFKIWLNRLVLEC